MEHFSLVESSTVEISLDELHNVRFCSGIAITSISFYSSHSKPSIPSAITITIILLHTKEKVSPQVRFESSTTRHWSCRKPSTRRRRRRGGCITNCKKQFHVGNISEITRRKMRRRRVKYALCDDGLNKSGHNGVHRENWKFLISHRRRSR